MKKKQDKLSDVDESYSTFIDDCAKQLVILMNASSDVMEKCGLIYPAIGMLSDTIEETKLALVSAIIDAVNIKSLKDLIPPSKRYKQIADMNRDFKEWRKLTEKKGYF